MPLHPRWLAAALTVLTALTATACRPPQAAAAELRMSADGRLVCRSVSHQAPASAPIDSTAAGVETDPIPGIDPPSTPLDSGLRSIPREFRAPRLSPLSWWADMEYLLWWRKGRWFPPLVTTSPPGTGSSESGILGYSSTSVAFGGRPVGQTPEAGGRLSLGHWLDEARQAGVVARFYALNNAAAPFSLDSTAQPNIARPFIDAQTGEPVALDIAYSGESGPEAQGGVRILSDSDVLGGDVYFRWAWTATPNARLDFLAGYQFARIDEDVDIFSTSASLEEGERADVRDLFWTRNEFHGGDLGLVLESRQAPWRLAVLAKVGLGVMHERVAIRGGAAFTDAQSNTSTTSSGLLAQQATNSGLRRRNLFAVSPEAVVTLSRRLTERWELSLGYSLLYWNRAVQPGSVIDTTVDRRLLGGGGDLDPAAVRPQFVFRDSSYWLQGLHIGLSCWF